MDKIQKAKFILITNYFIYLKRLQKGHPYKNKGRLKESMMKLDLLENNNLPQWQEDKILDFILTTNYND